MREVVAIDKLKQAKALLNPVRLLLLDHLDAPRTCKELADLVNLSQQRLNHHLKAMVAAGVVKVVGRAKKRNLLEATYERAGKAYWFSPRLARRPRAGSAERDGLSLSKLLVLAETLQDEVGRLFAKVEDGASVPSLGFDAEVTLRSDAERQEFTRDLLRALHGVIESYQAPAADGERFRVMIMAYPHNDGSDK